MTLEEAIKHAEEVAEENEKEFRLCPYPTQDCNGNQDCRCLENGSGKGCLRCAAEHRQLAEWLKELKTRRETPAYAVIDGKTYASDKPILKAVHGKTGEVTIGRFYEVKNED
jgi:hypothetical protein